MAAALLGGPVCASAQDSLNAQGATAFASPAEIADAADAAATLKPGQWTWEPEAAPVGALTIYVDLSLQVATVYRGGARIGATTISSGRPGYETPAGVFTVLTKDVKHRSKKYDNAPMPFTQRLTWDGVALHAGGVPGYPESHGCVHLPYAFAKALFAATSVGVTVVMTGEAPSRESLREARANATAAAHDLARGPEPVVMASNR